MTDPEHLTRDDHPHHFRAMPETGMDHLCIECGHTLVCGRHWMSEEVRMKGLEK